MSHVTVSRRDFMRVAGAALASQAWPRTADSQRAAAQRRGERIAFSYSPRIVIVSVGTAGAAVLGRLPVECFPGVVRVSINADPWGMEASDADVKILLDRRAMPAFWSTKGFQYRDNAVTERIVGALAGADFVLILGGLGGGTASAVAPLVARHAREAGALTASIVTAPFGFEGRARNRRARAGLADLVTACDTAAVIPNDRMVDILGRETKLRHALERLEGTTAQAARTIVSLMTVPGRICVDYADIRTVLQGRGVGAVGVGAARGPDRAERAARQALACPFLRGVGVDCAGSVLFQIAAGDPSLYDVWRASSVVWSALADDAILVYGDAVDPTLGDELRITLVAAGLRNPPWPDVTANHPDAGDFPD